MTIPDYLPTLGKGAHHPSSGEACVMEYVSILAGEAFSDSPACTHPIIASMARGINDSLHEDDRHLLIPVIPRLLSANVTDPMEYVWVSKALREYLHEHVGCVVHFGISSDALIAHILGNRRPLKQIEALTGILDEFDRLTGRTIPAPEVPEYAMACAVARVEQRRKPIPPIPVETAMEKSGFKSVWIAKIDQMGFKWIAAQTGVVPESITVEKPILVKSL